MNINKLTKMLGLYGGLFLLSASHAKGATDDDILDLVMPPIWAVTQKPVSGVMTIPINQDKQTTSISCWPGKCVVPMKKHAEYILAPNDGYKFCAKKIDILSGSNHANASVTGNASQITVIYDIPCNGGGVSAGSWNSAIGSVVAFVVGYFAGPQYSAGILDLINGTATVGGIVGGQLISTGTATILNASNQEGACGVGDAGIWLNAHINVFMIRSDYPCPVADAGWSSIE